MSKEKKSKQSKNCSTSKRILWYGFTSAGLLARGVAALALFVIAVKMHPLKYQADLFNTCVEEIKDKGKNASSAVNFCNGGS